MFRFPFELWPLDEVTPWGGELHWFGLTEGTYGIEVDGHELLRPPADYYVVRLWEDVNVLTPDILEPVPADLLAFIASDPSTWTHGEADFMPDDAGPDAPDPPAVTAAIWHSGHYLDLGYLQDAPHLRLWRAADEIHLNLRHGDDAPLRLSVPLADYLDAVHTLDRTLMAAMEQRIAELERRGGPPGVELDLPGLRREHEDRSQWLARSLARTPDTKWESVRRGVLDIKPR